jgi:hypothetical protein
MLFVYALSQYKYMQPFSFTPVLDDLCILHLGQRIGCEHQSKHRVATSIYLHGQLAHYFPNHYITKLGKPNFFPWFDHMFKTDSASSLYCFYRKQFKFILFASPGPHQEC